MAKARNPMEKEDMGSWARGNVYGDTEENKPPGRRLGKGKKKKGGKRK